MNASRTSVIFLTIGGMLGFAAGIALMLFFNANAGDLEPTAPPGPTMKTLDEVEPRIPIPGSSSPTGAFVITSSGSYYLTGDRYANGGGIVVTVDNVTIDLNGYSLIGGGYDVYPGVYMNSENNVEIRNGTIRNFQSGIYESNSDARNHRVIDVRAVSNSLQGIYLAGNSHMVKDCTASDNGAWASSDVYGIYVGTNSTVTGSTANNNGASASDDIYGIYADARSTVTGNTACNNGDWAGDGDAYGIFAGQGCTVTGNTACDNGDLADAGDVYGIYANEGCTVTGNTANENATSAHGFYAGGIYASSGCTVTGNTARENGHGATSTVYGIYPKGSNLVDHNAASYNVGTNLYISITSTYGVNEH